MVCPVANDRSPSYPVYLITGNDPPGIEKAAQTLFDSLTGSSRNDFNVDIISEDVNGPTRELIGTLINAIRTPSFMGDTKTVWLKNFSGFAAESSRRSRKGADRNSDPFALGELTALLQHMVDSPSGLNGLRLVISGAACEAKSQIHTFCRKYGEVRLFNRPERGKKNWREEMGGCLQAVANLKGVTLTLQTRDALIDALGADTSLIEQELEKLICYAGPGRTITPDDVHQICALSNDEPGWVINDLIGRRDLYGTLAAIERLLAQDSNREKTAFGLLYAMASRFTQLLQIRLFMSEQRLRRSLDLQNFLAGLSSMPDKKKELMATDPTVVKLNPWVAKFAADGAMNFSPHELIGAVCTIRDALLAHITDGIPYTAALTNAVSQILRR